MNKATISYNSALGLQGHTNYVRDTVVFLLDGRLYGVCLMMVAQRHGT
jgi:hypothetical protein